MNTKVIGSIVLSILALTTFQLDAAIGKAKTWTVTERQEALGAKVQKGEKSNELTKKEADKLRSKLVDVNSFIEKAKVKNGGKLSYKDEGKAEKMLNSISVELEKKELDKRVQAK